MERGIILLLIITSLFISACTSKYYETKKECTMELLVCQDGTTVGRSGPNCEFKECPKIETSIFKYRY